jgi:hypothetical protein
MLGSVLRYVAAVGPQNITRPTMARVVGDSHLPTRADLLADIILNSKNYLNTWKSNILVSHYVRSLVRFDGIKWYAGHSNL